MVVRTPPVYGGVGDALAEKTIKALVMRVLLKASIAVVVAHWLKLSLSTGLTI